MGSDDYDRMAYQLTQKFQSPLPAWGATDYRIEYDKDGNISIPAPRMGSDFFVRS